MFDNLPFKTSHTSTIESFLKSNLLKKFDEKVDYDRSTGEQFTKSLHYKYYNLNFTISYSAKDVYKELTCKGSFHYLSNKGLHNANNINFTGAEKILIEFAYNFNIDLSHLYLKPPEFGINIKTPFYVEDVVENVICERRKEFAYNPPHIKTSKISGKPTDNYRLKFYSKSHDCPKYADDNLLRMESQFKKVRALHKKGIFTLADLLNIENWRKIRDVFFEHHNHIVIYDYTIVPPKSKRIQVKLRNYSNQNYWRKLIRDCKKGDKYNERYNDELADLKRLSKKYGSNMFHKIIEIAHSHWDWFLLEDKKTQERTSFKTKERTFYSVRNKNIDKRIFPIT